MLFCWIWWYFKCSFYILVRGIFMNTNPIQQIPSNIPSNSNEFSCVWTYFRYVCLFFMTVALSCRETAAGLLTYWFASNSSRNVVLVCRASPGLWRRSRQHGAATQWVITHLLFSDIGSIAMFTISALLNFSKRRSETDCLRTTGRICCCLTVGTRLCWKQRKFCSDRETKTTVGVSTEVS